MEQRMNCNRRKCSVSGCFPLTSTCQSGQKLEFCCSNYHQRVVPHLPAAPQCSWTSLRGRKQKKHPRGSVPQLCSCSRCGWEWGCRSPSATAREGALLAPRLLSAEEVKAQGGVTVTHLVRAICAQAGSDWRSFTPWVLCPWLWLLQTTAMADWTPDGEGTPMLSFGLNGLLWFSHR